MKSLILSVWALCAGFFLLSCAQEKSRSDRPNVIFFLVDDMGWKDAGCYGSSYYETPAIDRLAEGGLRFTQAYSAHPVCGPSRASILSGKIPLRLGNTGVMGNLPATERTIAEAFKDAGYATFFTGKWHVGMTEGRDPLRQGFDFAIGTNPQGQPGSYFYPYKDRGCDLPGKKRRVIPERDVQGLENGEPGEYLTDRLTEEAIKFIERHKEKPFFVYLSHYAVHTPLEGKPEYIEYYQRMNLQNGAKDEAELVRIEEQAYLRTNQSNPIYAAMIQSMDESLGTIMEKLDELGLSGNTIIVFTSDNGGLSTLKWEEPNIPTSNAPLRYGKGWVYEGGIRVPAIIKYPKMIKEAKTSDMPVCHYDLYPTILQLAGLPSEPDQHTDGMDLLSVMNAENRLDKKLYWYFPQNHGSGHVASAAMRHGRYKLIWFLSEDRIELYDLEEDISEKVDLSARYPVKASKMKQILDSWIRETEISI